MCAKSCSSAYPEPQYDAFVAHSSEDRQAVEELVQTLENRGVKCYDPDRDFMPGVLVIENMENGIALSRKTIIYLTQNFIKSRRCLQERVIAEQKSVDTDQDVIVDILVGVNKATLPRWLRMTTYVDIQSPDFLKRLLKALGVSMPEERAEKSYEDLKLEIASLQDEKGLLMKQNRTLVTEKEKVLTENKMLTSELQKCMEVAESLKKTTLSNELSSSTGADGKIEIPFSVPAHWEHMSAEERYRMAWLGSKEWQEVEEMVRRTAGVVGDIWEITRIQNPSLYKAYQAKKCELYLQGGDRKEWTLYYETTGYECYAIMEHGFQSCKRNNGNKPYGNGIYFMSSFKDAFKDARVSYGVKLIIVAKVMPGRCVQARPSINMQTNEQDAVTSYDSVVDKVKTPSMVMIHEPSQAYPEYVVVIEPSD